jgi:hypothetical protein
VQHGVPLPADPSINTVTTVFTETATTIKKRCHKPAALGPDEVHGFIDEVTDRAV